MNSKQWQEAMQNMPQDIWFEAAHLAAELSNHVFEEVHDFRPLVVPIAQALLAERKKGIESDKPLPLVRE